jgi:hypothetical protein
MPESTWRNWETLISPEAELAFAPDDHKKGLAVVVWRFDEQGWVTSAHQWSERLRVRLSRILSVVLSANDDPRSLQYHVGRWYMGGDEAEAYSPALCTTQQTPDPFSAASESYLYGPKFKPSIISTLFGCREWAAQLYDRERPYIDVTSYVSANVRSRDDLPYNEPKRLPKNWGYIQEFIGWGRFGEHKPVIEQHRGHWYCFHDCPQGAKPGRIADIRAWAQHNGWPVPVPPTRMPVFPDPPRKQGVYPRDATVNLSPSR